MRGSNKFHFTEIDWILYFPFAGNEGRDYPKYGVDYLNRKKGINQPGKKICLQEVLNEPEIKENYPHKVSHYEESEGKGKNFKPSYKETRTISNEEEFFKFLSDLKI